VGEEEETAVAVDAAAMIEADVAEEEARTIPVQARHRRVDFVLLLESMCSTTDTKQPQIR
jgi:hypothetical protein